MSVSIHDRPCGGNDYNEISDSVFIFESNKLNLREPDLAEGFPTRRARSIKGGWSRNILVDKARSLVR
jgi:hypothetical protein